MIDKLFFDHPRSVGETYWQHFRAAGKLWLKMVGATSALAVHAFVPGVFKTTASSLIEKCHGDMVERGIIPDRSEVVEEPGVMENPPTPSLTQE